LDVGEFIMTRVQLFWITLNGRDYGLALKQEIIRESRHISQWSIKSAGGILKEYSRMERGTEKSDASNRRVSYILIQAPPNAKGFEKAEVLQYFQM
jgi:hypothetical protein